MKFPILLAVLLLSSNAWGEEGWENNVAKHMTVIQEQVNEMEKDSPIYKKLSTLEQRIDKLEKRQDYQVKRLIEGIEEIERITRK